MPALNVQSLSMALPQNAGTSLIWGNDQLSMTLGYAVVGIWIIALLPRKRLPSQQQNL